MRTKIDRLKFALILVLALGLLLPASGMAQSMIKWVNPDKTAEEQKRDMADCERYGISKEHNWRARGGSRLESKSDFYDDCMRDKGYSPSEN